MNSSHNDFSIVEKRASLGNDNAS